MSDRVQRILFPALVFFLFATYPAYAGNILVMNHTDKFRISIAIRNIGKGVISIQYNLPANLRYLHFSKNQALLRKQQWSVLSKGATLTPSGLSLGPASGTTRRIGLVVHGKSATLDRVYPILLSEADGAVVLNTAAFLPQDHCSETYFTFVPKRGNHVILRGHVYSHKISVPADCAGVNQGSYVYMGAHRPQGDSHYIFSADPSTPKWIVKLIQPTFEAAIHDYRNWLHRPLAHIPSLFVTYERGNGSGNWYHGDRLDNDTIRLTFAGNDWLKPDPKAAEQIRKLAAHEPFHFWNSGFEDSGASHSNTWLLEGGAELGAIFILAKHGWDHPIRVKTYINRDLNLCLLQSANHTWDSIPQSLVKGRIFYTCGVAFNYMAGTAVNPQAPQKGFATLWRDALAGTSRYSASKFLANCDMAARHSQLCSLMRESIGNKEITLTHAVQEFLQSAQIPFKEIPISKTAQVEHASNRMKKSVPGMQEISRTLINRMLMNNLVSACAGHGPVGYWTESGYLKLDIPDSCKARIKIKTVAKISGIRFMSNPVGTYETTRQACLRKGYIVVQSLQGHSARLPCNSGLAALPIWFYLGSMQAKHQQELRTIINIKD